MQKFADLLRPHLEIATENGVTLAIENHANNLIESPDSMKWLLDFTRDENVGIALAPYHLPQNPDLIGGLIRDFGSRLAVFYAWQHGMGCTTKLPKEQELLQMPGRGDFDFTLPMKCLAEIDFQGWTEIFMHPVPRGVPILATPQEVTKEINHSKAYLENCL